jgi:hypothetical protein
LLPGFEWFSKFYSLTVHRFAASFWVIFQILLPYSKLTVLLRTFESQYHFAASFWVIFQVLLSHSKLTVLMRVFWVNFQVLLPRSPLGCQVLSDFPSFAPHSAVLRRVLTYFSKFCSLTVPFCCNFLIDLPSFSLSQSRLAASIFEWFSNFLPLPNTTDKLYSTWVPFGDTLVWHLFCQQARINPVWQERV